VPLVVCTQRISTAQLYIGHLGFEIPLERAVIYSGELNDLLTLNGTVLSRIPITFADIGFRRLLSLAKTRCTDALHISMENV